MGPQNVSQLVRERQEDDEGKLALQLVRVLRDGASGEPERGQPPRSKAVDGLLRTCEHVWRKGSSAGH